MFWVIAHLRSLTPLNPEQQRLWEGFGNTYQARYIDSFPDPKRPFRIYAFRMPLAEIKAHPKRALGNEANGLAHEVVHFFQHYLVPENYSLIGDIGHSDIISSGIASLIAYSNGLDPCDEIFFKLPKNNHYHIGVVMALRCKDDCKPFQRFRERLDRYIEKQGKLV